MFRDCGFYNDNPDARVNWWERQQNNKIKAFENALPKELGHDELKDLPKEITRSTIRAFENAKKVE